MEIHDVNEIPLSTPLEKGMLITIEPGAYIPFSPKIPNEFASFLSFQFPID